MNLQTLELCVVALRMIEFAFMIGLAAYGVFLSRKMMVLMASDEKGPRFSKSSVEYYAVMLVGVVIAMIVLSIS